MTNFSQIRTLALSLLLALSATLSPFPLLAQEAKPLTDIPLVMMKRINLCGNSVVDSGEACDNGMQCENGTTVCKSAADCAGGTCAPRSGDGCSADCLSVEMKRVTTSEAQVPVQQVQATDTVAPLLVEKQIAPQKMVAIPVNVAVPVKVVETPPPPPAVIAERPLVVQKVDAQPPAIVAEAAPAPVAVEKIPWVAKTDEVVVKPQEANIIAAIPTAEKPIRKIVITTDTPQPTDDCVQFDASSLDYKCCLLSSPHLILARELRGGTANSSGLTPEETMACQCRADPTSLGCPCLGKHQIDDLNACASASGADTSTAVTFKIDETTGKVIGATGDLMRSETNVCACASPQPFDKHMACDTVGVRRALRAKFSGPSNLQLACLYPEQVDALKGVPYVTVEPGPSNPSGPTYKITTPLPLSVCTTDGGTSPETQQTQPETRRLAMAEEETIKYKYQDAPMLDAEGEQPAAPPAPADEVPVLTDGLITRGEVPCTIVKPQCPCAPPEVPTNPPETLQAPPPPLPPPPPPATLQARLCFCRWHEFEALCPDTNESIVLKDECPALTMQAFTSSDAHALYMTASAYFGKPEDAARKKKLVDAANTNLMSTTESDTNPTYSLSTLGSVAEDGASLVPVSDRKSVKALFQTSAVALSEDGTLKVNDPQAALQIFSGGPAALTSAAAEGPQVVSVSDLFKNQSAASSPRTGTFHLLMGVDYAAAEGGGGSGGCGGGNKASLIPDDAPWTAVGPWTLAMAALTLITWRFLPLKRRILTGSSIKTRVKGSSTKN